MKLPRFALRLIMGAALACSAVTPANASDYMGYVQSLVQIGSRVFIYVGGGWFGTDHCGSARQQLVIYTDVTNVEGRIVALATSAKLSGVQVYAAGNGTCYSGNTPSNGTSEAMNVIWLQ